MCERKMKQNSDFQTVSEFKKRMNYFYYETVNSFWDQISIVQQIV